MDSCVDNKEDTLLFSMPEANAEDHAWPKCCIVPGSWWSCSPLWWSVRYLTLTEGINDNPYCWFSREYDGCKDQCPCEWGCELCSKKRMSIRPFLQSKYCIEISTRTSTYSFVLSSKNILFPVGITVVTQMEVVCLILLGRLALWWAVWFEVTNKHMVRGDEQTHAGTSSHQERKKEQNMTIKNLRISGTSQHSCLFNSVN